MTPASTLPRAAKVAKHRKPAQARHPEPVDQTVTRKDMPVALMVWAVAPMLAILLGYWIAS